MSSAIVEAIRAAAGKRLAIATGYIEEVNGQFRVFLEQSGFNVVALRGLGLLTPPDNLPRSELETFVIDVLSRDRCTAMDDDYRGFKSRPSPRLPASVLFSVV